MPTHDDYITAMAKHLPPSSAEMRVLDIGGVAGDTLTDLRADVMPMIASLRVDDWNYAPDSVDAVVAYDTLLKPNLLEQVLRVMRAGGRFIVVNPAGEPDEAHVQTLENAGYVRILVEAAVAGAGVLLRGEKAHTTSDTIERVQGVASADADLLDLENYRGRYVHLLVQQTPNKPVWKRAPDEPLQWHAVTLQRSDDVTLLAFSSLPKAVSFMQPAVMQGVIKDVNKVGKFSKATAATWAHPVLLNPTLDHIDADAIAYLEIDPTTAEAPDE
jgi:SAM-dependent methyltransferase